MRLCEIFSRNSCCSPWNLSLLPTRNAIALSIINRVEIESIERFWETSRRTPKKKRNHRNRLAHEFDRLINEWKYPDRYLESKNYFISFLLSRFLLLFAKKKEESSLGVYSMPKSPNKSLMRMDGRVRIALSFDVFLIYKTKHEEKLKLNVERWRKTDFSSFWQFSSNERGKKGNEGRSETEGRAIRKSAIN